MKRIALAAGIVLAASASNGSSTESDYLPAPPHALDAVPVSLLVDLGSGQQLHARQPDLRFVPASMTKVMTVYVAFELIAQGKLDPAQRFTVRPVTGAAWHGKGSSMFLRSGGSVLAGVCEVFLRLAELVAERRERIDL